MSDEDQAFEVRFARLAAEQFAASLQFYLDSPAETRAFMRQIIDGSTRWPAAVRIAAFRVLAELSMAEAEDLLRRREP